MKYKTNYLFSYIRSVIPDSSKYFNNMVIIYVSLIISIKQNTDALLNGNFNVHMYEVNDCDEEIHSISSYAGIFNSFRVVKRECLSLPAHFALIQGTIRIEFFLSVTLENI